MDKIRQQKLDQFLLDLDGKMKEIKEYLLLDKGAILLDAIAKFEEENAEFLQYNPAGLDELNKRKWIIQYLIFPLIADDKVEELLQYHLLEAMNYGLDLEELMRMRAITISELLWPKLSQQYLKALMQNTQLIGGDPIGVAGEKTTFLPYVKNWISLYNRKFGIDKHTGLETHQFVLEDTNTQKLGKKLKESLLKVLRFYESLKVYSLSEIEADLRKMQLGFAAQQAAAYSVSQDQARNPNKYPVVPPAPAKTPAPAAGKPTVDKKIKIMTESYPKEMVAEPATPVAKPTARKIEVQEPGKIIRKTKPKEKPELVNAPISKLLEDYPVLQPYKLTSNSISLKIAPFSLAPTIQNWIQYYTKECGKGKHSLQERNNFLDTLEKTQNISPADLQKLEKVLRSVDEHTPLPFDKQTNEIKLDLVKVGEKLKAAPASKDTLAPAPAVPQPVFKMGGEGIAPANTPRDDDYLDIQLMPAAKEDDSPAVEKQ
jgi:hypothetical protein